jgi:hypothetical protein
MMGPNCPESRSDEVCGDGCANTVIDRSTVRAMGSN